MALFVCRPADINLDNANTRIVEVLRKPCWFREHIRKPRAASPDRNAVRQFNLPPLCNVGRATSTLSIRPDAFGVPIYLRKYSLSLLQW